MERRREAEKEIGERVAARVLEKKMERGKGWSVFFSCHYVKVESTKE